MSLPHGKGEVGEFGRGIVLQQPAPYPAPHPRDEICGCSSPSWEHGKGPSELSIGESHLRWAEAADTEEGRRS